MIAIPTAAYDMNSSEEATPRSVGGCRQYSETPTSLGGCRRYLKTPRSVGGCRQYSETPRNVGGCRQYSETPTSLGGYRQYSEAPRSVGGCRQYSETPRSVRGCRQYSVAPGGCRQYAETRKLRATSARSACDYRRVDTPRRRVTIASTRDADAVRRTVEPPCRLAHNCWSERLPMHMATVDSIFAAQVDPLSTLSILRRTAGGGWTQPTGLPYNPLRLLPVPATAGGRTIDPTACAVTPTTVGGRTIVRPLTAGRRAYSAREKRQQEDTRNTRCRSARGEAAGARGRRPAGTLSPRVISFGTANEFVAWGEAGWSEKVGRTGCHCHKHTGVRPPTDFRYLWGVCHPTCNSCSLSWRSSLHTSLASVTPHPTGVRHSTPHWRSSLHTPLAFVTPHPTGVRHSTPHWCSSLHTPLAFVTPHPTGVRHSTPHWCSSLHTPLVFVTPHPTGVRHSPPHWRSSLHTPLAFVTPHPTGVRHSTPHWCSSLHTPLALVSPHPTGVRHSTPHWCSSLHTPLVFVTPHPTGARQPTPHWRSSLHTPLAFVTPHPTGVRHSTPHWRSSLHTPLVFVTPHPTGVRQPIGYLLYIPVSHPAPHHPSNIVRSFKGCLICNVLASIPLEWTRIQTCCHCCVDVLCRVSCSLRVSLCAGQ